MLPKTAMQKTSYSGLKSPNFVHLRDREQDPEKLFKKYHVGSSETKP
jgi:hypothetical protein